jgi:TolB-like protein
LRPGRGVLRVAASYSVIAWLVLQIADVTLEPLGLPKWLMTALIIAAGTGLPVAIGLAWFLGAREREIEVDTVDAGVPHPAGPALRHYADAIVIAVLLVTVVVLAVRRSDLAMPKAAEIPVIAVLPFDNESGDPAQQYFSDGLAQEMLDRLGRMPGLTVISRASSFSFRGKNLDPTTIAGRLGATTLLLGGVRRTGSHVRLSVQLVDGGTGRQVWSGTFDRDVGLVDQVKEELAAAVYEAVAPAARGKAVKHPVGAMRSVNAYDLYLLGRSAQEERFGARMRDAVSYLEQAVEADPRFAKAHAALARALSLWKFYPYEPAPVDAAQRAEAHAHQALALDPDSSEAHAALGTVLRDQGNAAGAAGEYRRALELNPNNAAALWDYIVLLGSDPATRQARELLVERLARIDPRSPVLWRSRVQDAAEGGQGDAVVSREVARAVSVLADDAAGLRLVGLTVRSAGHATDAYRICLAIARAGDAQAALFLAVRTWMLVDDLDRAERTADKLLGVSDEQMQPVAQYLLREIAGIKGDFSTWNRLERGARLMEGSRNFERAFWLAVQERYPEAARSLEQSGPPPDGAIGGLGSSLTQGQLLPAVLRIYRATGRGPEADSMAQAYLAKCRQDDCGIDLAALTANEGLKDESVQVLQRLFRQFPLVEWFHPGLPWFRNLAGHPGYDELLAERSRRVSLAHAEMMEVEAQARGTALDLQH